MIRAAVIFLALVLSAAADVTMPRFLDNTRLVENWQGKDGKAGELGPYQIRRATWEQHMGGLPFALARQERWGRECARRHVAWLQGELKGAGIDPNAFNLALAYNAGLGAVLRASAPERAYLEFLANPSSLTHSQRWLDCKQDYVAFNRARQADWHERKAYGPKGSGRFARNRFAGAKTAQGEPQETFDPQAARKRHMSMAVRNRQRTGYRSTKQPAGDLRFVAMIGGKVLAGPAPAGQKMASTAKAAKEEDDENCPF